MNHTAGQSLAIEKLAKRVQLLEDRLAGYHDLQRQMWLFQAWKDRTQNPLGIHGGEV